jgi:hypothetical protein
MRTHEETLELGLLILVGLLTGRNFDLYSIRKHHSEYTETETLAHLYISRILKFPLT